MGKVVQSPQQIDVTEQQFERIEALIKQYIPNMPVWFYGSRVAHTARPNSDLDMVVFAEPNQRADVSELKEAFEESDLPFRIDLFIWDEIPESFHANIKKQHVVVQ